MRTKGKSEGKNPGIEAIMISSPTIKKSSSSSSIVVVTQIVLVITRLRVNRLEEHCFSLWRRPTFSTNSNPISFRCTNAPEYPSPVNRDKGHPLLGSRRLYNHQIHTFQRTSCPLVLPGSTSPRLRCGFDPCLHKKEDRGSRPWYTCFYHR